MVRCAAIVVLSLVALGAYAEETQSSEVGLVWTATPWLPNLSAVTYETSLDSWRLRAWYLAHSAFLLPVTFFETGAEVLYGFGERSRPWWQLGLGTAFSLQRGVVSVPVVVETAWLLWWTSAFRTTPLLKVLFYGEGQIGQVELNNRVTVTADGWWVEVGGSAAAAVDWSFGMATALGLRYGAGWSW